MNSFSNITRNHEQQALQILIVDDDALVIKALARQLRGHTLYLTSTPAAALDILKSAVVDLVLTDFDMPSMDGITLLEKVRREFPAVRRALMSASPPAYLEAVMTARIVEHFVAKPFLKPLALELIKFVNKPINKEMGPVNTTSEISPVHGPN